MQITKFSSLFLKTSQIQIQIYSGKKMGIFHKQYHFLFSVGIFGWAMGMGPVKGFSSGEVQEIVTKKHDQGQNKIAKEDAQTATFAAGLCPCKELLPFQLIIYFGPGCFWGVQLAFQRVPGVASTMVGNSSHRIKRSHFVSRWDTLRAASSIPPIMTSALARLVR